jgi:hypothetical protein
MLKGGSRRCFLRSGLKGSSGALDGGGAPPDTERAIPEVEPGRDFSAFSSWAPPSDP